MTQEELVVYWKGFLKDLFVGTFFRLLALGFLGFGIGLAFFEAWKRLAIQPRDFSEWLEWIILIPGFLWYAGWGIFHGLGSAMTYTTQRKLTETIGGLQGLLDLLSRQFLVSISKPHKTFTKEEVTRKFNSLGYEFLNNLRLKSFGGWIASILFSFILKGLRFMFLDEIEVFLSSKPENKITTSDIESAVRRVGVNTILSPITEQFLLIYILIFVLIIFSLGFPFLIFCLF